MDVRKVHAINENDIELIDILLVIWMRKNIIIFGTLMCLTLAVFYCIISPKKYAVTMVIEPSLVNVDNSGKDKYIDDASNIQRIIDAGFADSTILNQLAADGVESFPVKLPFITSLPPNTRSVLVTYVTGNIKLGIKIQKLLLQRLQQRYADKVRYYKDYRQSVIDKSKLKIEKHKELEMSYQLKIKNFTGRIKELESEYALIDSNTKALNIKRNNYIDAGKSEKDTMVAMLYMNVIQQNLQLSNSYRNQINSLKLEAEDQRQKLLESENNRSIIAEDIKAQTYMKNQIQNIQVVSPPTAGTTPVKPNLLLITVVGTLLGLFSSLFAAFMIEYIKRKTNFSDVRV